MSKKLLKTSILAVILVAALLGTTVNAASLDVDKAEIKAGDEVTVSVNVDEAIDNANITFEYDADQFSYVDKSAKASDGMLVQVNSNTDGIVKLGVAGGDVTTNTISITLKSEEDIPEGEYSIRVTSTNIKEELENDSAPVTVVTAEEPVQPDEPTPTTPTEPTNPTENPSTGSTETPGTSTDTKVGTDGKTITKLPQTGAPVFVGAIALIVVAAAAIVLVKKSK